MLKNQKFALSLPGQLLGSIFGNGGPSLPLPGGSIGISGLNGLLPGGLFSGGVLLSGGGLTGLVPGNGVNGLLSGGITSLPSSILGSLFSGGGLLSIPGNILNGVFGGGLLGGGLGNIGGVGNVGGILPTLPTGVVSNLPIPTGVISTLPTGSLTGASGLSGLTGAGLTGITGGLGFVLSYGIPCSDTPNL